MASYNRVILIGNLTRDPEIKYTPKGTCIANIGMAMNRIWHTEDGEKQEEVTFVDVEAWGRTAEIAQEYLHKGSPLMIEGRLKLDSWEDKNSGEKRYKLRVVVEHLQLLGSKDGGTRERPEADATNSGGKKRQRQSAPPPQKPAPPSIGDDDTEDTIPF